MNDLIFVVKLDGSYELTPTKNLRAQENYANSFVVITNKTGIVKLNIKLLSRTDRVLSQFMIPTLESPADFISDRAFFQDYANAKVYRIALDQSFLEEISMSFKGEVEVSFDFLRLVSDPRAITFKGDLLEGEELPETATEGDYFVIKTSSYTLGTITFSYGQTAIWTTEWVKGGAYKVIGTTLTHKMNVEQTLIGQQPEFDIAEESELLEQLVILSTELSDTYRKDEVYTKVEVDLLNDEQDLVIGENANDITALEGEIADIKDGTTIVKKAEQDGSGRVIEDTYVKDISPTFTPVQNALYINWFVGSGGPPKSKHVILPKATTVIDGLMAKEDKAYVDGLPNALLLKENKSEKGVANGYASLDGGAKIPTSQLPDSILGQLEYKGTFDPSSGYPVSPEKGWFYIAIANALISGVDYKVGDWAVYNGSSWDKVDNTDAVASVNGKLGAVILYGNEIQVGNGDTWTIEQRIVNIYAELNNRYTKAQTYSNAEIEQRITDLLGLANLQDTEVEFSSGVNTLTYDGSVVSIFPATLVAPYNWVFLRILVGTQSEYTMFKPSMGTNGVGINLPLTQKDVFAQVKRVNDNFEFALYKKSDDTLSTTTAVMRMWGIKLDGINADEIIYSDGTVKEALDSLLVPAYITATHEILQTEITATDAFEINDETGDVIKITGNEPTNLVVNGDFSDGTSGWLTSGSPTIVSTLNGSITLLANAQNDGINQSISLINGDTYYLSFNAITSKTVSSDGPFIRITNTTGFDTKWLLNNQSFYSYIGTSTSTSGIMYIRDFRTTNYDNFSVGNIRFFNISQMQLKGVRDDNGIPFTDLTNGEIKSQLDIWVENGFPTVVEKLISKSDNLFNAKFNTLSSLDSENLVTNGDLLLDSNSDNVPDGSFVYQDATNISLTNGIAKFTATAKLGRIYHNFSGNNQSFYLYSRVKTGSNQVAFTANVSGTTKYHSGSGQFEYLSSIGIIPNSNVLMVLDYRTSGWTPIEVDYIGAINITDLVNRGILPAGLTNNEYKEMIDKALFDNVPLRETDYIAVEPSKAYKLIKVSANEVTHKVIEYTTDNQVVKVTPVVYTTNKFTFTTHALTSKIKLVSDMLERPVNLVANSNILNDSNSDGVPDGFYYINATDISLTNGIAKFTATEKLGRIYHNFSGNNQSFYLYSRVKTGSNQVAFTANVSGTTKYHSGSGQFEYLSSIGIIPNSNVLMVLDYRTSGWTPIEVDYMGVYNVSDMIRQGVKNDSGTLFSRLTNDEIKDQMDIWVKVGFPDHVIAALYPNGVDSAIALKYNDADDIFRPQQIDELPLNLTLRSGEYWQDGYVVKQNGNAEYYPLDTKFSAWNYGQLEAVYTSGVPADFDIQYAQNTAAQVKTTQEFLVEAREQLDYVTDGYDNLVEKLGDAIFSDKYDSYAGITSDTYEYYTLEGVKEGNTLAIEGAGQSIQNLLGKGGTVNATTTTRGVTVTYDTLTGVFTANGTATAGAAFNITLATGMDFGLPVGTPMQLLRYYDADDGGTVNLNGSYIGYVLLGTTASNRINENSEALYDPYINGSGNLNANHATNKQEVVLQVWSPGIVFTNFKFKIGIYQGLQLRPFILPSGEPAKTNVTVYNRTANKLNMPSALDIEDSGLTLTYDPLVQEFLLSGTATATKDISLNATFNALSGGRFSIKRLYQSGDVTAIGGTLPRLKLVNSTNTTIVYNDIYKMTAPEGETPTPDVTFNTGTAPADATLTLKLGITNGQIFDNYRFRLMIHDKSTDIGYVAYHRNSLGNMSVGANERAVIEFKAIPYGILEFVAGSGSLNLLFADSITDLNKTYLEYNAGIISPNRKISELTARAEIIDNPFRNKVIAVWGDSRESNNPTSYPTGVGDQKDTSWPALLAKKLSATVLNYGLSGGAWAENTVQQDAASAIVNRVQTEDVSASADVIVISSMNDFKLASTLGSPLPANKDKTTFYGAMRLTYDRLATKYPGKKIILVLPQKRYDETVNYGGGSYYHYLKAQVEVAKEYGIPIVDLYHNLPNTKPTFYATYMLNDTHFSAVGNDWVAELVARELIGNGNKGDMDLIPSIPTTDGSYTLKVTITGGIPVFSWVID